ncbi:MULTISPECIES: sensor domain-containing diguanylate cyclase [unclassified Pseudoalteromonas]|uniref:sensor domain-containing diguanylate cyclase n=1 Tax=unclassified Pseudoalteromonas TaxID=194690 RepID=UPI0025B2B932|nr:MULTISPECIES: sensor domain-containing diguanylate cyclase [unclassified Pseudoalteromonas]MDN3379775.1 sensor domain-containing diguanylate cyclase [Pseudoalteromonas sp. APC 3893]MDN3388099.1 sensor domain-containing diguanylate cyclase [Pseudoalteromonas sp. APC 4017]
MIKNDLVSLTDVLELMLDAVCIVDKQGHFLFVSAAFETIFGYPVADVIGRSMIDFVYHEDKDITLETVEVLLSGTAKPRFENRWVRKDGGIVHILWSVCWSEQHQVRIAVAHDITERKEMEKQLHYLVGHDPLTELPNRVLLLDRLRTSLFKAERDLASLAVLFIDIDGFKDVNDNFGHIIGDQLLAAIAQRLLLTVRKSDTVGRLGGDEFLVLIYGIKHHKKCQQLAEKIRLACSQPFVIAGHTLNISSSIGMAIYPDKRCNDQQLIQYADNAMYKAKKAGGNQVITA